MTTRNPFPGMNPFFEHRWRHAHTTLIVYLCEVLQERLPPDLVALAEEGAVTLGGHRRVTYLPDGQVREPSALKEPSVAEAPSKPPPTPATDPIRVFLEDETQRWLEIRDKDGRLITALELLCPSNKLESAERDRYFRTRQALLSSGVNLVEIDLVRQGAWLFPLAIRNVLQHAGASYGICVLRATRPEEGEVYPVRLRERLPSVRVPLRPTDADVVAELQPLIDQCHERGRFHLLNYRLPLEPTLPPEDAAWADQLLRENHLL